MSAIFGRPLRKRAGLPRVVNHYVEDRGHRYRVCVSTGGHILLVMRKNVHVETALDPDGRRFREIVKLGRIGDAAMSARRKIWLIVAGGILGRAVTGIAVEGLSAWWGLGLFLGVVGVLLNWSDPR